MYFSYLANEGYAYIPEPWDIAQQMWYWDDPKDKVDVPLPKDSVLYLKRDRLDKYKQHCLEISSRAAHQNLRVCGYIAHIRRPKVFTFFNLTESKWGSFTKFLGNGIEAR